MRNDFDDDVSTTNDALSVVCGWSVFFYALSLSLFCVCVCMCVYVCIYITTIRVPSFPLRSFPKGSRVQPKCGAKDTTRKSQIRVYELSCVCVCVCVSRFSLSLWFGVVVTFSSLLFQLWFSPSLLFGRFSPNTQKAKRRQSLVLFLSRVVVVL